MPQPRELVVLGGECCSACTCRCVLVCLFVGVSCAVYVGGPGVSEWRKPRTKMCAHAHPFVFVVRSVFSITHAR